MKKLCILGLLSAMLLGSGCSYTPKGNPVGYVLGAGGGALLGSQVSDEKWAPAAGAAAGLLAYAAYSELSQPSNQKLMEAYEQGKREARTETSREFWINETDGNGVYFEAQKEANANPEGTVKTRVMQEQRYIEGVNYGAVYYTPTK